MGYVFSSWRHCHYFVSDSGKDAKNIAVRCKLCRGSKKFTTEKNMTDYFITISYIKQVSFRLKFLKVLKFTELKILDDLFDMME